MVTFSLNTCACEELEIGTLLGELYYRLTMYADMENTYNLCL